MKKHEYLEKENYYEDRRINKGRIDKTCEHCRKDIPAGMPHTVHTFYPHFYAYPTHDERSSNNGDVCKKGQKSCSELFIESLN